MPLSTFVTHLLKVVLNCVFENFLHLTRIVVVNVVTFKKCEDFPHVCTTFV